MEMKPPLPTRLEWDFKDQELQTTIMAANEDAQKIINVSKILSSNSIFHELCDFVGC